jgi:MYXO-CTERM domain-containing protein
MSLRAPHNQAMRASFFFLSLGICAGALFATRDARACGGCFHEEPRPQQQQAITVVTDHRMIFAVSKDQTTLYDQIRYQGDPEKFAWVLPIADTVEVGLSADVMFASLDQITKTTLNSPQLPPCPPPPICGSGDYQSGCNCIFGFASSAPTNEGARNFGEDAALAADSGGVQITKQEVVGPYETVQIKASDPMSITDWLAMNKFAIPDDVKPIIAAYQKEGFGFLALKLQPGLNVNAMRPVRVTTKGAGLTLPLRMVAAGTGASVGITLWIVAEGRYEPQNFPFYRISDDDLVWDWATASSNYATLRDSMTKSSNGFAWEIESSLDVSRSTLESLVLSGGTGFGGITPAEFDYDPVNDPMNPKTAEQVRQEDFDTIFSGMQTRSARITRIRADLSRAALATDLALTASADQGVLSNVRMVTKDTNRPACPTYPPCPPNPNDGGRGGSACNTTTSSADDFGMALFATALVAALLRRRRRS